MAVKKRKRNCTSATETSGPSIADLPVAIFFEIILKLSTKGILLCKCVCKTWRDFISDSKFAKLHLAQAKPCPLIRNCHELRFSRALYMLDRGDGSDFSRRYGLCGSSESASDSCRHNVKVKTVLKIPLRNSHFLLDGNAKVLFGTKGRRRIQGFVKVSSKLDDHIFRNSSSCNGLLCLSEKDCVVICNPITGEFIYLPEPPVDERNDPTFIFGFNPKTDQYKVVRFFRTVECSVGTDVEIQTLGTNSWRNVVVSPLKLVYESSPIYFNGALQWFCSGDSERYTRCIACFDLDEEQFRSNLIPLPLCLRDKWNSLAMAVLGGRFCVYQEFSDARGSHIEIWGIDELGITESWTRLFSIDSSRVFRCRPLMCSSDGALLLFNEWSQGLPNYYVRASSLIYFDRSEDLNFKRVGSLFASRFNAIVHTPSFVSLKNMVNTNDVKVFNVYSGCGKIKLLEEAHPIFLQCWED